MNVNTTTSWEKTNDRSDQPLTITVVGKTLAGKTAVVRTFTKKAGFGKVSHEPNETTEIKGQRLQVDHETQLIVYDSPGLQYVSQVFKNIQEKHFTIKDIKNCYEKEIFDEKTSPTERTNLELDLKVLEHIVDSSDLVFLVIDISEEKTTAHEDMALVLSRTGKPVIPLMNFVHVQKYKDEWEKLFRDYNYPLIAPFDANKPLPQTIESLHKKMELMLDHIPEKLKKYQKWTGEYENARKDQLRKTADLISTLVLDAARSFCLQDNVLKKEYLAKTASVEDKLKEKFLKDLYTLENECHREIVEELDFDDADLEHRGHEWEAKSKWKPDILTNLFRWVVPYLGSYTGTLVVYADKRLLEDLLERALVVATLFRQRGHGKEEEDEDQEVLEKRSYNLDEELRNELMGEGAETTIGNPLLLKVLDSSENGRKTNTTTGPSLWLEKDDVSYNKLRDLIRRELRKREELQ